ncbi:McrB family protein [Thermococcus aggregans]|uniref:McrB family protein n=1 Tax=Thermococcus aggregans TaxID=110163 RepID=A0A9E7SMN0_THEAG|nr:McrB family protein [Thermococcus aggregans]USS39968.1 McrB family protein [Thermococcus aggregans]
MKTEKPLKEILLELKKKYSHEWEQYESETFKVFRAITRLLLEETPKTNEIVNLLEQLPPAIRKMLYYVHGPGYYSNSMKINILNTVLTDRNFREFLTTAATVNKLDDSTVKTLEAKIGAIKIPEAEVGLSIISTWASIVNPNIFMPIHGNVQSREFREIIRRTTGIQLVYGGGWRKHISDYLEFLKKINQIKPEIDIKTAFEAAFYMSKFSRDQEITGNQKTTQNKGYYLEITKPPGKLYEENHVGRFLWSPADQKYWNGREGKMGLLKPGDIILHDVNGELVGYSKVKEEVKEVSKEEIIKIFTEEGIWTEKYSKFAEDWFKKSLTGKFYLVRLEDFKELDKTHRYTEVKGLPHPARLQGVYLTEISPRVLEELGISLEHGGKAHDQNQHIPLSKYLKSEGYLYPEHLIAQFYTALKTKGFVILSGLTGTGKTKIVQKFVEILEMPQLMSASGKNTKAEREIKALQDIIKRHKFAVYGWKPAGKAKDIKPPFIFWLYDSDPNDKFYQKVPYGIIVSDVWTDKENLPKEWKSATKWVETVYSDETVEKYINEHEIFFKVWKVIECGSEISKFRDIAKNRELSPRDASRMQNGYALVKAPEDCTPEISNHIFLSVRPDWRDSKPLLGYYNPLTGEYHKTSLLEFILRAKEDYEQNRENAMPYFIILDEMNLAHVEYYFADFLSVLESGRDESGFTKESIKLHDNDAVETFQGIPKELKLPPNLYIIGTVNIDETTYSFSPKVLDRAFTIEFHDVDLENYPPEETKLSEGEREELRRKVLDDLRRNGKFLAVYKREKDSQEKGDIEKALERLKNAENGKYWEILNQLNKALEPYDLHFGYRVVDEIALFFKNAKESWDKGIVEFESDDEIFDLALLMKVLPKFHGNRKKLEEPLKVVLELCLSENAGINVQELGRKEVIEILKNWETEKDKFLFKHTAKKVLRMLRQLYEIGFASFS